MEESCDLQVHESCKKEKYSLYNSLVCVAHGVIGLYTTVDLRNDSYISGKVDHIDGYVIDSVLPFPIILVSYFCFYCVTLYELNITYADVILQIHEHNIFRCCIY